MASKTPAPPARRPPFVDHCVELLAPLGPVTVRRMFGGWGLYADGLFMALIAFERLYLKADAQSRERFAAAGCEPFSYDAAGQQQSINYWTAPADALESPALMAPWARLALQAALTARAEKAAPRRLPSKRPSKRPSTRPSTRPSKPPGKPPGMR